MLQEKLFVSQAYNFTKASTKIKAPFFRDSVSALQTNNDGWMSPFQTNWWSISSVFLTQFLLESDGPKRPYKISVQCMTLENSNFLLLDDLVRYKGWFLTASQRLALAVLQVALIADLAILVI